MSKREIKKQLFKIAAETQAPRYGGVNLTTEIMSPFTATIALALLGAGLSGAYQYATTPNEKERGANVLGGAIIGGGLGTMAGLAAPIVGAGASLFTPTRTKKEQIEEDKKSHVVRNAFLPGIGTYNMFKRLGYAASPNIK